MRSRARAGAFNITAIKVIRRLMFGLWSARVYKGTFLFPALQDLASFKRDLRSPQAGQPHVHINVQNVLLYTAGSR